MIIGIPGYFRDELART